MSLLSIAVTFQPLALAVSARSVPPHNPCSSPDSAAKTMVARCFSFAISRAASITSATPEPSSLAPGASLVASITSVTRLSIWPATMRTSSLRSPGRMPSTSSITTPPGARGPVKLRDGRSTVRPSFLNSLATQLRAAPMPRLGSVADDKVWRVPNDTSLSTEARRCAGSGDVWAAAGDASTNASRAKRRKVDVIMRLIKTIAFPIIIGKTSTQAVERFGIEVAGDDHHRAGHVPGVGPGKMRDQWSRRPVCRGAEDQRADIGVFPQHLADGRNRIRPSGPRSMAGRLIPRRSPPPRFSPAPRHGGGPRPRSWPAPRQRRGIRRARRSRGS